MRSNSKKNNSMKIKTTLLISTLFLFTKISYSQCAQCQPKLLPNGGFEILDPSCNFVSSNNYFILGCVDSWRGDFFTAELFPNSGTPEINSYINSNMVGMLYGPVPPIEGEGILSEPLNSVLLQDTDISQHLSFEYGAFCKNFDNKLINIIEGSSFNVSLKTTSSTNSLLTKSILISDDIRNGLQQICIESLPINQGNEQLSIRTEAHAPNAFCYALFDNFKIECEIIDHDYSIEVNNLNDFEFEFDLIHGGSSDILNFVSFAWDFGDGTTSSLEGPIIHIYSEPGIYDVCVDVIDDRGCCMQICTIIVVTEDCECDFSPLLTNSNSCTTIDDPISFCPNYQVDIATLNQCQCCEDEVSFVEFTIPPCSGTPIFTINHLWSQIAGEYEIVEYYNTNGNTWRVILTNSSSQNPTFIPCNTHPVNNHPSNQSGNVLCPIGTGGDGFELIISYCGESYIYNVLVIDC